MEKRDRLGCLVGSSIYIIMFLIYIPFFLAGTYYCLIEKFDLNEIGRLGAEAAIVKTGTTHEAVFSSELDLIKNGIYDAIHKNIDDVDPTNAVTGTTYAILGVLGGFKISLFTGSTLDVNDLIEATVNNFSLPMLAFKERIRTETTVPEVDAIKNDIAAKVRTEWMDKFEDEAGLYIAVARASAEVSLQPYFSAVNFHNLILAMIVPPNSQELTALLDGGYGKGVQVAQEHIPYDLMVIHLTPYVARITENLTMIVYIGCIPPVSICLVIVIAIAVLAFINRHEPEVRSKYYRFLIYIFGIFLSWGLAYLIAVCSFLDVLNYRRIIPVVGAYCYCAFPLYFSALNFRHRLMYNLFILKNRNANFFTPLVWYIPLFCCVYVPYYFAHESYSEYSIDIIYAHIAYVLVSVYIISENFFYTYQTRKAWDKFVDFYYNVRTLAAYFIIILFTLVMLMAVIESYQLSFTLVAWGFACSYLGVCYFLDSFVLPLAKIYFRRAGNDMFKSVSFEAQNEEGDKNQDIFMLIQDRKLCDLLLAFSEKNLCQENVLFLIDYDELLSTLNKANFEQIYKKYCIPNQSEYELNLSAKTMRKVLSGYERIKEINEVVLSKDQVIFAFDQVQLEISRLVRENLLGNFKALPEAKKAIEKRENELKMSEKLMSSNKSKSTFNATLTSSTMSTTGDDDDKHEIDGHEEIFKDLKEADVSSNVLIV